LLVGGKDQNPMKKWLHNLKYDPVASLLKTDNEAILALVRRDLLDEAVSINDLWQFAEPQKILRKQQPNGSWKYPSAKKDTRLQRNYDQYETFTVVTQIVPKHYE
jgi:hypothetical protein